MAKKGTKKTQTIQHIQKVYGKKRRKTLREMKGERRKENEKKSHSEHKESCICDELKNQHNTHTAYIPRDCSLKRRNRMKRRRKKTTEKDGTSERTSNEAQLQHSTYTAYTIHVASQEDIRQEPMEVKLHQW